MHWYRNLRMTAKIVLPVGLMLILALGALAWQIRAKSSSAIEEVAKRELAFLAGQYGNEIKALFEMALDEAQAFADSMVPLLKRNDPVVRDRFITMLQGMQEGRSEFLAAGTAWEPNAYDGKDAEHAGKPGSDKNGRFIPYSATGHELTTLQDLETSDYYAVPKRQGRSYLTNPYFYNVGGKQVLMATASAVIKLDNRFRGIVLVDISLNEIMQSLAALKIYQTGWGACITQDGTIVATSRSEDATGKNIFDTAATKDPAGLRKAMADGKPFMEISDHQGKESFFYYYPIHFSITGQTWYFMVNAPLSEVLAGADQIGQMTMIFSGVALLLCLLLIFIVVRISVRPLGVLAGVAQEIAGGNLNAPIHDETFGGEVRELSAALKNMIISLIDNISKAEALSEDARAQTATAEEAMREAEKARQAAERAKRDGMLAAADQLEEFVNIISAASEELSAQVEQSERGSNEQAQRVSETATAMNEMSCTVAEVARNASQASNTSADTRARAEEGARVVQDAVKGIQNVQAVSLMLKEDMNGLTTQAQGISQIMSVISDIADQTNLLALNAAIEAARAGEAGRGFAVVADEVRKLAEKTMTSTTDVGNAIKSIQTSVDKSTAQVDRAVQLIDTATEQSNRSGFALGEIVTMVDATADQVRAIATASEQQASTCEEINSSVVHINSIAEQTALAMREAAQAVSNLASQAQSLSALIEDMKRG